MTTPTPYTVAVRALCEFAAKTGDLDLRFTPAPTALQGIEGHQSVTARRGGAYRTEVTLSGEYRHLRIRGRADGYDPDALRLEEIKTYRGEFERLPANHRQLHWAQAKVYGWLLCRSLGLPGLTVALVYFEIGRQQETVLTEICSAAQLQRGFETLCERFIDWADREIAHRRQRDQALTTLRFAHAEFREGQRPLAEAVFKAARQGRCLMAQAPTGIGKTIGTLFPLLKACPGEALDKIFYLTAKGPGAALALAAIDTLRAADPSLVLRVAALVARDKACEHPDKACHGESCPLARGFYDRLPAARLAAISAAGSTTLTQTTVREIALAHQVCPYYLGQALAHWADVVVGDYNYFFDTSALLHALTIANAWRVALLVDEAHNLVERARAMYSAPLAHSRLRAARKSAPAALQTPLNRLHRAWQQLIKPLDEGYQVLPDPPRLFVAALQEATGAIAGQLADDPLAIPPELRDFYFEALQFTRLAEGFGAHSLFDASLWPAGTTPRGEPIALRSQETTLASPLRRPRRDSVLNLRNIVPAAFLAPRFAAAHATVLFSATLSPPEFYRDMLGLPASTVCLDIEAPFKAEQLTVRLVRQVSTRYAQRATSLAPIARLMAAQYATQPGNYLAFFSSYDYLGQVMAALADIAPAIPCWEQRREMDTPAREAFLARFTPDSQGIGFAVLGGAFAEGIDLPGARLIGAFIATLGLPPFNPVNEAMRERMEAAFGAGYDYTYLYPGIRKVVQAAGRVIRTPADRGSIHLIDDRFGRPEVRRLLPRWWAVSAS